MKLNTKRTLASFAGILLSAGDALASAPINLTSTDVISNLGFLSGIGGLTLSLVKWGAIFVSILSLLILWATGNLYRTARRAEDYVKAQDGIKKWAIDSVIVVVCFILLFGAIIPLLNQLLPTGPVSL